MTLSPADTSAKRRAFKSMHESGIFVMPNPWDVGTARYLQGLGFKALATTSSGFSWSMGQPDGSLGLEPTLEHLRTMVAATSVPINADFENGFATDPKGVEENVRLAIETGVAGLSIEDSTGELNRPLYDLDEAVARIRAARSAIDKTGGETLLVGRAENHWLGHDDINDTITRLKAYAAAGADCLYAPGIRSREQISAIVSAVAPKPFNLLVGTASDITVHQYATMGVRRISVGGALARIAWGNFMKCARNIAEMGRFNEFADGANQRELNTFFRFTRDPDAPKLIGKVVGSVAYVEGDGPMIPIPTGRVEISTTAADAVLSWSEGAASEVAALPLADFCYYVSTGAIVVDR